MVSYADLLEVIEPNPEWRDMSRVRCKYFGKCSGCQYQVCNVNLKPVWSFQPVYDLDALL